MPWILVTVLQLVPQARIPIGRLGKPDEIASIAVMLLSNGYMTNKVRNLHALACSKLLNLPSSHYADHRSGRRLDDRRYLISLQHLRRRFQLRGALVLLQPWYLREGMT